MSAAHIPAAFYDASGCLTALHALTRSLQCFSDAPDAASALDAIGVVAGLADVQAVILDRLTAFINATEGELMQMGVNP